MNLVKTKSFELAIYAKGDEDAARVAIVIPGRLDTKNYIHMTSHVDYLASKGYYALSFDPPGSWESPGGIEIYTTTNTLKAINEIIDLLGNRPTVLIGHSRGGSNAMSVGITNKFVTQFVAIMSNTGPSKVGLPADKNSSSHTTRDMPPGITKTVERKSFILPYSYFEDQMHYDSLSGLKICDKPKLFFYGTNDVLVSKEVVVQAYSMAGDPKEIYELESPHDYRKYPEIIEVVNQTIGEFLARTN